MRRVAAIGSPIALGTALLFYFGWVRGSVQARALGYDMSLIDLTTPDYLLKSVDVLSVPIMLLLVVALLAQGVHRRIIALPNRVLTKWASLLLYSWLLWLPLGTAVFAVDGPLRAVAIPATVTLALLAGIYGNALRTRIPDRTPWTTTVGVIIAALLAIVVFWDIERLARVMGEGTAAQIAAEPDRLPRVTVYSVKDLTFDPPVTRTSLPSADAAYRYRYEGFRLLQRSGDRYLLLTANWTRDSGCVVALRDSAGIRLEFRP